MASPLSTAKTPAPHVLFVLHMLPLSSVLGLARVAPLALLRNHPNEGTVLISVE
jgi:hypothetical protein